MGVNHVQFTVPSLHEAKIFYLAALAPLGYTEYAVEAAVCALQTPNGGPDFWFGPTKGPGDSPTKGLHIAFTAESRAVVEQFHEAALKAGAKDNGAPGLRAYIPGYYAAYVLDPYGNNIEAVHFEN